MIKEQNKKARLLWIVEKEIDIQHNKTRIIEIINNLEKDYSIKLLTGYRYKKIHPEILNNKIIYYESSRIPYIKRLTRYINQCRILKSILKSFNPEIVLFNSRNLLLLRYAAFKRKKYNLKLIFDVRTLQVEPSTLKNRINNTLLGYCLKTAVKFFYGITYITEPMKEYCIKNYRLHEHKSTVWTSGVNTELFTATNRESAPEAFTILYHGSIAKRRNIDNTIKALSMIKELNIHLILLGDGDGLEHMKKLVLKLGIKDSISFILPVPYIEIPKWINRCDAGILPLQNWPAWNVSSPIKLFEYLACSKPVIVTDIQAHRSVLNNSEFVFWIKQSSPDDIKEAILQAYNKRNELKALGLEASRFVKNKYTWAKQAEKLKQFFN